MKSIVSEFFAVIIITLRRTTQLVSRPYVVMRNISKGFDIYQIATILVAVYLYFMYAVAIRHKVINPLVTSTSAFVTFGYFFLTWILAISFYFVVGKILYKFGKAKPLSFDRYVMLFAYSLIPTLLWFFMTSTLYLAFPPPRYETGLGKVFSLLFVVVSLTLLMWRVVLWYLSLRFSFRAQFFTIVAVMVIFMLWFVPYTIFMYKLGIFRIPFI